MFSFLIDPFRRLFAAPPAPPAPPPPTCPALLAARVDRAVSRFVDLDRLYGLGKFADRDRENGWRHDLKVMAAHRDLKEVRMEFLDHHDRIAASMAVSFGGAVAGGREVDDIVTPLIQRRTIRSARLLVTYNSLHGRDAYQRLLRLTWTDAARREALPGGDFGAGADLPGRITLRAQDRRTLTIQGEFWDRGYAYAFSADLPGAGVFVHAAHCANGFRPRPGERFTAYLVQTNRGLQARDVRPA